MAECVVVSGMFRPLCCCWIGPWPPEVLVVLDPLSLFPRNLSPLTTRMLIFLCPFTTMTLFLITVSLTDWFSSQTCLDINVTQIIASSLVHQHCTWELLYCGVRCHLFGNDFQSNTSMMLCEALLRQYFQVNMWKSNESSFPPWSLFHLVYPSDFTGPHLLSHFLRPLLFLTPNPPSSVCLMSNLVDSTLKMCPPRFPLCGHGRGASLEYRDSRLAHLHASTLSSTPSKSFCLFIRTIIYLMLKNLNSWF